MSDETKPTDDSKQRELEKREARERESERPGEAQPETRGDALLGGVEGAIPTRSD